MLICFVSNYINHHQIPFCEAMCRLVKGDFYFIQTQPMEEERVKMGWQPHASALSYVKCYYEEGEECRKLIQESDVVLFGGCDDESYIKERLLLNKPVMRLSERLYKTGQWKALSPRGLWKKYQDHTKYRKSPSVGLLCCGGYVPSDFGIVHAYPDTMFRWGYFPQTRTYDVDKLLAGKGYQAACAAGEKASEKTPYLLWAARMIDWKHPELPVLTAKRLKERGLSFHLDMVGGGEMEPQVRRLIQEYGLEDCVALPGYRTPDEVRSLMEKADIYLVTSDRQEGWGAVVNEAMNSGCAVVADHMIGAVPYLIRHGENGLIYKDGAPETLFAQVETLLGNREMCRTLGRNGYRTITEWWNAEYAAKCLMKLLGDLGWIEAKRDGTESRHSESLEIPCTKAPVIPERKMYDYLMKR